MRTPTHLVCWRRQPPSNRGCRIQARQNPVLVCCTSQNIRQQRKHRGQLLSCWPPLTATLLAQSAHTSMLHVPTPPPRPPPPASFSPTYLPLAEPSAVPADCRAAHHNHVNLEAGTVTQTQWLSMLCDPSRGASFVEGVGGEGGAAEG